MRALTATSITQSQAAFVVSPAPPVHLNASMPTVACWGNNPLSEEWLSVSYCTQRKDHEGLWGFARALLHTAGLTACMAALAELHRLRLRRIPFTYTCSLFACANSRNRGRLGFWRCGIPG